MTYNADNDRVEKQSNSGTTKFVWDEQNYLLETDAAGITTCTYTNEPVVYGNAISQRRAGDTIYLHFNAVGSTREATDSTETVTDTWVYDAWGNVVNRTGTTLIFLGYIGQLGYYVDPETGLFWIRKRPLEPTIARWTTTDPFWPIDDRNPFTYAGNNPVGSIDPSGLKPRNCSIMECLQCTKTAQNKDTITKALYQMLKLRAGIVILPGFRPGCKPDIACRTCRGMELGGLIRGTRKIDLCANRFKNFATYPGSKRGKCAAVYETFRHELIHLVIQCRKTKVGGRNKCESDICNEISAYRESGQCKKGSVWRDENRHLRNELECLLLSAANSASGACGFVNAKRREMLEVALRASKQCRGIESFIFT